MHAYEALVIGTMLKLLLAMRGSADLSQVHANVRRAPPLICSDLEKRSKFEPQTLRKMHSKMRRAAPHSGSALALQSDVREELYVSGTQIPAPVTVTPLVS